GQAGDGAGGVPEVGHRPSGLERGRPDLPGPVQGLPGCAGRGRQKEIRRASWTNRGFAALAMICPKLPGSSTRPVLGSMRPPEEVTAVRLLIGLARFTWLSRLKN